MGSVVTATLKLDLVATGTDGTEYFAVKGAEKEAKNLSFPPLRPHPDPKIDVPPLELPSDPLACACPLACL